MKKELMQYIDTLFDDVPENDLSKDLKDEITSDMMSRYDDCLKKGMSPAAAYAESIKGLGNVDRLIEDVKQKSVTVSPEQGFSVQYYDAEPSFASGKFGAAFERFFRYIKPENEKVIHGTMISVMWLLITIFYFVGSFITGLWNVTWIIFLVGAVLTLFIDLLFGINKYRREPYSEKAAKRLYRKITGAFSGTLWLCTTIAYFIISVITGWYNITWLIFIVAAIIQIIMSSFFKLQKNNYFKK